MIFQRQIHITCGRFPLPDQALRDVFGDIAIAAGVNANDRIVPKSIGFHGTPGEFGRLRAHSRVLEDAIVADAASLLVLEDDARAEPDAASRVTQLLASVPDDWQCILLGGRHVMRARPVRPGVVRCSSSGLSVAYAIRGEAMRWLYGALAMMPTTMDQAMQELCRTFPVYAADPFCVGQAGGRSTTTRDELPPRSFNDDIADIWVSHSGNAGDAFYAGPAIRAFVQGRRAKLYLFQDRKYGLHPMGPRQIAAIRPLLELQPYIAGVEFWPHWQARDSELNNFREYATPGRTIADAHLAALGLPYRERDAAWITVDRVESLAPVVIARSPRYRNPRFRWDKAHDKYAADAVFVGTRDEYELYTREVGSIRWHQTADFLEVARVIAGAKLFVGNQSAPLAIAEGMKKPVLVEVSPTHPDCTYRRPGAVYGVDETVVMPEVQ